MQTAHFKSLGITIQYNEYNQIENFKNIGHIYCSNVYNKVHNEKIRQIADESNDGQVGPILRYNAYGKKEWYVAPSLKVFWSSDWE